MDKIKEIKHQKRLLESNTIRSIDNYNRLHNVLKTNKIILNNVILKQIGLDRPIILKKIYDTYSNTKESSYKITT
jgi:hypothetical protein